MIFFTREASSPSSNTSIKIRIAFGSPDSSWSPRAVRDSSLPNLCIVGCSAPPFPIDSGIEVVLPLDRWSRSFLSPPRYREGGPFLGSLDEPERDGDIQRRQRGPNELGFAHLFRSILELQNRRGYVLRPRKDRTPQTLPSSITMDMLKTSSPSPTTSTRMKGEPI